MALSSLCHYALFFTYNVFKSAPHPVKQDFIFVSICLLQWGSRKKFTRPGVLLGWPSKTHSLSRSRVAADWPLALFHWKRTPTGSLFGFEKMLLYLCRPPYSLSTILIIMTLNENLHTGPIYEHTKELRCSSVSQYEFCYWVARDEAHCWCFIMHRKEFLKAKLVSSQ